MYAEPQGRRIKVYRNGDPYHKGINVVLNTKHTHDIDQLLDIINDKIGLISGAKRLYTLKGRKVNYTDSLEHNKAYVASSGPFTSMNYGNETEVRVSSPKRSTSLTRRKVDKSPSSTLTRSSRSTERVQHNGNGISNGRSKSQQPAKKEHKEDKKKVVKSKKTKAIAVVAKKSPKKKDMESTYDDTTTECYFHLCKLDEIDFNKPKRIYIGPKVFDDPDESHAIVLIKTLFNGDVTYYALPDWCPYCLASLHEGVLVGFVLRCDRQGSGYDIRTGELVDGPGFDNLPTFKTLVVDETVAIYLAASIDQVRQTKVVPKFGKEKFSERHTIVVGSGPAALTCIETLRKEGWGYPITMVTKEDAYPYDRQLLSKNYISNDEGISIIRDESFFNQELDVYRWLKTPVNSIDYTKKTFIHDNDPEHPSDFQNLVLAMGSQPKKLQVPGAELSGIHYFRTKDDAIKLYNETVYKDNVDAIHVCIIGSELLAYELAGMMVGEANIETVVVIDPAERPFSILGSSISAEFSQICTDKGITISCGEPVKEFIGDSKKHIKEVHTNSIIVHATIVIICQGVKPATSCLDGKKIKLTKDGHVIVNKFMQTSQKDVYAIGDCVEFPLWKNNSGNTPGGERRVTLPYWYLAQVQGRIAARAILGKKENRKIVPFFWTNFLGYTVTFCGDPTIKYDKEYSRGNMSSGSIISYFLKNDEVVAVSNYGPANVAVQFIELFQRGTKVTYKDIEKNENNDWISYFSRLKFTDGTSILFDKEK